MKPKSDEVLQSDNKDAQKAALLNPLYWIPMFFYISGIGSTFFNTERKNYFIFIGEKMLRLLLPFVIGIFVFLMPRLYLG